MTAEVRKSVAYSAVLSDRHLKSSVRKSVVYAVVVPHNNGDVVQPGPDLRPIYQSGSVPYIDFAGGKSFTVEIPETSVYTLLVLRTDLTFDRVRRVMFTEGVNNIILTGQVAQFRYLKGDPTPQQIEDFKEEMLSFYANPLPPSVTL